MDDLEQEILAYVKREYLDDAADAEVTPTSPLISGGVVDSFSMVSLKRHLEKRYGIAIPDAEASPAAFDSVASIAALVARLRGTST